jgi:hypothetical protein
MIIWDRFIRTFDGSKARAAALTAYRLCSGAKAVFVFRLVRLPRQANPAFFLETSPEIGTLIMLGTKQITRRAGRISHEDAAGFQPAH